MQSYKCRYNRAPLRFWPAKFWSERIRKSISYSNNDSRPADITQQAPCPCHLTCRAGLSARETRFFNSQKLKNDITGYEIIYLQNNCHQLISRLRMSGAVSSLPPMPSCCGKRWKAGNTETDKTWVELSIWILITNICGNKTQQQENKLLEQAYCRHPVTRLDENCCPAFRTSSVLLRLTMRFKQLHHPMQNFKLWLQYIHQNLILWSSLTNELIAKVSVTASCDTHQTSTINAGLLQSWLCGKILMRLPFYVSQVKQICDLNWPWLL